MGPAPDPPRDLEDWAGLHALAVAAGEELYADPDSGLLVMTELCHRRRGKCCGSGCRHCPFEHTNVRDRSSRIQQPAWIAKPAGIWLAHAEGTERRVTVLCWSGGKDSFLALRRLIKGGRTRGGVVLLTTFDAETRLVAHQEVAIATIERQARHLGLPLVGVPLHRRESYVERLGMGLGVVEGAGLVVDALAFGDLHLAHIREWRETELGKLGPRLCFPLWSDVPGANYEELLGDLAASGVVCTYSAVPDENAGAAGASVGAAYSPARASGLFEARGVDVMGEKGEFHTLARVWDVAPERALGLEAASTG